MPFLGGRGHSVVRAVRGRDGRPGEARWDPASGRLDLNEPIDAVVHLASENLASRRWSAEVKRAIRDSRVGPTRALSETLAAASPPPALVAASAAGVYGDRGDEPLDETSALGNDFLGEVGQEWEAASDPLRRAGGRVVHLRKGLVLAAGGGAFGAMLLPFRLGLGGPLGGGRQYWSWIGLDDVLLAYAMAVERPDWSGPFNLVAPEPSRQREFARAFGRVLHRPAILPTPAFGLRIAMGEMADALVLSSQRVFPRRLLASGFEFRRPVLEDALAAALGREV